MRIAYRKWILLALLGAVGYGCWRNRDWLIGQYRDFERRQAQQREEIIRRPAEQWSSADRLRYPAEYAKRREEALPTLPCTQWTNEEKERHPRLFLTNFRREIEEAVRKLEADIQHWEQERAGHAALAAAEAEKIAKAEDFMRQAVPLLKGGEFPVVLHGISLSKSELEQHLISYQTLRKNAQMRRQQHLDLQQAAAEQLTLKRRDLAARHAEAESSRVFIARLDARERIGSMHQVMAEIRQGLASAQAISNDASPVFAEEHRQVVGRQAEDRDTLAALQEEFK